MPVSTTNASLPEPTPEERDRSALLTARITERIVQSGGWLPFSDYMHMALYEPGLGYYDAQGRKFGAQGDFVTAPEISPLFSRTLARPVRQALEALPAQVLEFGAGTGALAADLIPALQAQGVEGLQYFIVEVSADLRARQRDRLAGLPVTWLDALPSAFEGVILANEVLDVLPVQLFVREADGVWERGVRCDARDDEREGARPAEAGTGSIQEVAPGAGVLRFSGRRAPAALAAQVAAIEQIVGTLPTGYGSEVCPLAGAWIAALGACLQRGLIVLLDYGFPQHEYYHPQRAMGTLMCHYRQHAHAQPLWLPGLNDITAHVDFSACARAAQDCGLDVLGYTSQAHFLLNCGILDLLAERLEPAQAGAVQRLVSEAEMGELVKVLALGRGLDSAPGFARGDRRHRL